MPYLPKKVYSSDDWRPKRGVYLRRHRPKESIYLKSRKESLPKRFFSLFKRLLPKLTLVFLAGILLLIGAFAWYSRELPQPDKLLSRDIAQSTKIFDRTGNHLLYEVHGDQKRTLVLFKDIPDYAVKATLTLEDRHFYEHSGFSLWGMFRGVILNLLQGKRPAGGSTLTQQLVKNAILTNDRSIIRKIKELVLSYQIERKYTKDQILQMYFNEIPYGSTAYGIEAAAYNYFGKSSKEITLAEAALLASLPQRPTYLSPYGSHLDQLYGRQQYCLDQMAELGYITKAEAEAAKKEKLVFKQKIEGIVAPHFIFYIKELLSDKYGDKTVEQGGLKIISTLDFDLQQKAEKIITDQVEKNQKNFNASNAALVSIDTATGQILSMVGSKDFFDEKIDGQVNVAISPRQPGSSFKPMVYTAAWQKGYVPETMLYDLETTFPSTQKSYVPHDYDGKERGPVSLRQALAGSLNIPAVKLLYLVGVKNVINFSNDLGYTTLTNPDRYGLSLVLGGAEVKLLEHTNAFATLAREGKFMPSTPILKVEDSNGKVLEEFEQPRAKKVIEPNIARITSDVLSDNNARAYIFGASNHLTLPDRPVAAKTGTTNDFKDAWTMGYVPSLATGVWVGNSDGSEMKKGADGSMIAAPIWQNFMIEALRGKPITSFNKPSYEIPNKPMLGGDATGVKVKIDKMTGLLATEDTPSQLIEERFYKQTHEILQYVNKDDPLGPVPENPSADPYYQAWEEPVMKWAEKQGLVNEPLPTEKDNLHNQADKPVVNFIIPNDKETINGNSLKLEVNASAPRGVARVEFYFEEVLLGTSHKAPFSLETEISPTFLNGEHKISVKAYDDVENVGENYISINLQRQNYLNINWVQPNTGVTLKNTSFPYDLSIYIEEISKVNKIDFYFKPINTKQSSWIGFIESPHDNLNKITWSNPPPTGTYKVYPVITDYLGKLINGPEINIELE
jgi:1A family penicillin-binding protein